MWSRYYIAIFMILAVVLTGAPRAEATTCKNDPKVVDLRPIIIAPPYGSKITYGISVVLDVFHGAINSSKGPVITAKKADEPAWATELTCVNSGDAGTNADFLQDYIYGCTFPDGKYAQAATTVFTVHFEAKMGNTSSCTVNGSVDFAKPFVIFPEEAHPDGLYTCTSKTPFDCMKEAAEATIKMLAFDALYGLDGDAVPAGKDTCPHAIDDTCTAQDDDGDGKENNIDNCRYIANANQADMDNDGKGDACDADRDGDLVQNFKDNCPSVLNSAQTDANGNKIGDMCETSTSTSDPLAGIDCDVNVLLVDPDLCCPAGQVFGSTGCVTAAPQAIPDLASATPTPATITTVPAVQNADAVVNEDTGGCTLATTTRRHSGAFYLFLSFLAVLSALGLVRARCEKWTKESDREGSDHEAA
jgi:hypothetical protein